MSFANKYADQHKKRVNFENNSQQQFIQREDKSDAIFSDKEQYIQYLEGQQKLGNQVILKEQQINQLQSSLIEHQDKLDNITQLIKLLQTFAEAQQEENTNMRNLIKKVSFECAQRKEGYDVKKIFDRVSFIQEKLVSQDRVFDDVYTNFNDLQRNTQRILNLTEEKLQKNFEKVSKSLAVDIKTIESRTTSQGFNIELQTFFKELREEMNCQIQLVMKEVQQSALYSDLSYLEKNLKNEENQIQSLQYQIDSLQRKIEQLQYKTKRQSSNSAEKGRDNQQFNNQDSLYSAIFNGNKNSSKSLNKVEFEGALSEFKSELKDKFRKLKENFLTKEEFDNFKKDYSLQTVRKNVEILGEITQKHNNYKTLNVIEERTYPFPDSNSNTRQLSKSNQQNFSNKSNNLSSRNLEIQRNVPLIQSNLIRTDSDLILQSNRNHHPIDPVQKLSRQRDTYNQVSQNFNNKEENFQNREKILPQTSYNLVESFSEIFQKGNTNTTFNPFQNIDVENDNKRKPIINNYSEREIQNNQNQIKKEGMNSNILPLHEKSIKHHDCLNKSQNQRSSNRQRNSSREISNKNLQILVERSPSSVSDLSRNSKTTPKNEFSQRKNSFNEGQKKRKKSQSKSKSKSSQSNSLTPQNIKNSMAGQRFFAPYTQQRSKSITPNSTSQSRVSISPQSDISQQKSSNKLQKIRNEKFHQIRGLIQSGKQRANDFKSEKRNYFQTLSPARRNSNKTKIKQVLN